MFQQIQDKKTYYTLISHGIKLNQNLIEKKQESKKGKLLLLLSITDKQVILFYEDFWFHHINIITMQILYKKKLEGRAYKGLYVRKNEIAVMLVEKKSIVHIDLQTKTVTEVFRITAGSYLNPRKQTTHFFLSHLGAFNDSGSFYLQQNLMDERKIVFIYFPPFDKDTIQTKPKFLLRQFEAKNHIYSHLDEISTIVRYRQNPQQNGTFQYEEINLESQQIIEYKIQFASFVSHSTVVQIRKIGKEKHLICLNSKNGAHQFIMYNKVQKTGQQVFQSQNIMLRCISINQKESLGIFSFIYGQSMYKQTIRVIDLQNGKIYDQIQAGINRISVPKGHNCFINYSSQTRQKQQLQFTIYSLVSKRTNYLNMLQNLKINLSYGQDFVSLIASVLQ